MERVWLAIVPITLVYGVLAGFLLLQGMSGLVLGAVVFAALVWSAASMVRGYRGARYTGIVLYCLPLLVPLVGLVLYVQTSARIAGDFVGATVLALLYAAFGTLVLSSASVKAHFTQ